MRVRWLISARCRRVLVVTWALLVTRDTVADEGSLHLGAGARKKRKEMNPLIIEMIFFSRIEINK